MKVSELTGPMLDYWVARAIGIDARVEYHPTNPPKQIACWPMVNGASNFDKMFYPSTNWTQGGPLVDRYRIMLDGDLTLDVTAPSDFQWSARIYGEDMAMSGPEPLIAAMRALVASKFGEEVGDDV